MAGEEIKQELSLDASETLAVLEQLKTAFSRFENALNGAGNTVEAFNAKAQKLDKSLLTSANAVREVTRIFEQTRSPLEAHNTRMEKYSALLESGAMDQELFNRAAAKSQETLDRQSGATARAAKQVAEVGRIYEQTRTPLEAHNTRMARYNVLLKKGALDQDTFNRAAAQSKETMDQASKAAGGYVLTLQTLTRVLMTQAIVRGLNMIRDALEYAYDSQVKFSKAVSEIRAIDTRSFSQISADVRAMSDAFNQPILTVAEAQYEVLSDQFTTLADRTNILTAANQLAKTTEDDLVASSQLLTGALNAYGESSEMAGIRAAQFFQTINLGRLRAGELGTALGRVQSIGHELGVSLEELEAALVAITIGGVKASEAGTQLRGILTALLKPSETMKKALKDLNVESGEAAIRTWGLYGALQKVSEAVGDSSAALGRLFPNVRGAAGGLRLLSEGAESYAEALEAMHKADQAFLAGKQLEAMSTDAARLTNELNKLRNVFTADLGADLVATLNQVIGLANRLTVIFGGTDGVAGVLRAITVETPLVATAIGAVTLALMKLGNTAAITAGKVGFAANTGVTGFQKFRLSVANATKGLLTLRNALGALALFEVGRMLGNQLADMIRNLTTQASREASRTFDYILEQSKLRELAGIREANWANNERFQAVRQYVANAGSEYTRDRENLLAALKIQVKDTEGAFDDILDARKRLTRDLFKQAEQSAENESNLLRQAAAIHQEIEDRTFNNQVERFQRSDIAFAKYRDRLVELAGQAAKLQAAAKDPEQQKLADEAWRRAEAYAQLVESSAQASGNAVLERQAQETINRLAVKHEQSLKRNAALQKQVSDELEKQGRQAEENDTRLEQARGMIQEKLDQLFKPGVSPDEMAKGLAEIDIMVKAWVAKVQETTKGDFLKNFMGDARAFEETKRAAERLLASFSLRKLEIAPEAMLDMWNRLQATTDKFILKIKAELGIDLAALEKQLGANISIEGFDQFFTDLQEGVTNAIVEGIKAGERAKRESAAVELFKSGQQQLEVAMRGKVYPGGKEQETYETANRRLKILFDILQSGQPLTKGFSDDFRKVAGAIQDLSHDSNAAGTAIGNLWKALDELNKIAKERAEISKPEFDLAPAALEQLQQQLDTTKQKVDAENQAKEAAELERQKQTEVQQAIQNQVSSVNVVIQSTGPLIAAIDVVREHWIAAAQAAAAAAGSGGVQTAARGGLMRYAAGGFTPRGTDTIPVMLSPGEFVMNAKSTRRFYSQLMAMNAGVNPTYRAQGGPTNITVGDIHVNGAAQPRETAREVIQSLKRELRRGTSKW